MKSIESKIDLLTSAIKELVNHPVAPVAPVLPVAPIAPILPSNPGDHDLLIALNVKMEDLKTAIVDLKYTSASDIGATKKDLSDHVVINDKVHDDFEKRLKLLEVGMTKIMTWGLAGILILGIVEFAIGKFVD